MNKGEHSLTTDNQNLLKQQVDETSLKYMLKLAAPMIVMNVSFTIMQFVDRYMVSRLGTEALAAILPAGMISFLPASFALGVMTSVSTFVSQSLGRGNKKDCPKYCWQLIYLGLAYSILTLIVLWPLAGWIFKAIGQPAEIIQMEVTYLRIMLYTQILIIFIWASSQFFMGIHRPIVTMWAAVIGQMVNIAANYVLIFGKFGFPAMGIAGAGWGTFIGVAVGTVIRMAVFLGPEINKEFASRQLIRIDLAKMKDLLKVGLPAGFGFMINVAFLGTILFALVGKFGTASLAATSAVYSCINVSIMPVVGLATALSAAVGKSIGKGQKEKVAKQMHVCLKVSLCYTLMMGVGFFVFRGAIMRFWSAGNGDVITVGMNLLICAAIFQMFDAAVITYNGALRGAGDTLWLAGMSACGAILILGAGGFMVVKFFPQFGAIGPWVAFTANIIFVGIGNWWRFRTNNWMKIDLFKRRPVGLPVEIEAVVE